MAQNIQPNLKLLSDCTLAEAVNIWNRGFSGYIVDMTLSIDGYVARLYTEQVSPESSFIAFVDGRPAGFLLNGIRTDRNGRKLAWNGGTGVASEFREQGIGRFLMEAAVELYEREGVHMAMLEAVSSNTAAIALYQNFGYQIRDRLVFLEHEGSIRGEMFPLVSERYSVRLVSPPLVANLTFYPDIVPWQAQWQSLFRNSGKGLIVSDERAVDVGYALYKREFNEQGNLERIVLSQCVADPARSDAEAIVRPALAHVFAPLDVECHRMTHNFSRSNRAVTHILEQAGFENVIEQVHLIKTFDR